MKLFGRQYTIQKNIFNLNMARQQIKDILNVPYLTYCQTTSVQIYEKNRCINFVKEAVFYNKKMTVALI